MDKNNLQEVPKTATNPLGRPLTIVFALPGKTFSNNFMLSWTMLFNYCLNNGINPLITNHYSNNIYYVRNMCLGGNSVRGINQKPFNGELDYDFVMWIDSDQVFRVEDFVRLLQHDKDIVSGIYLMEKGKEFATVETMNDEVFTRKGHYDFLTPEEVMLRRKKDMSPLMKVDYTGMGWMLVKNGVFEKLKYPWFSPEWREMTLTDVSGVEHKISEFTMEDVAFCQKVKQLGIDVLVDTNVVIGHEKSVVMG